MTATPINFASDNTAGAAPEVLDALVAANHGPAAPYGNGPLTLALEQRSSEVWQVLGAVKTEFGKFGDVLGKIRSQAQTVLRTLEHADVRNRAMQRALRSAEALPDTQAQEILGTSDDAPLQEPAND